MTQRRVMGVALLLLLAFVLTACGAAPVAQQWPGLTVADGTVYVTSGSPQQIYLLDAQTGVQQRSFGADTTYRGAYYWSPVAVGGGLAYVGFGAPDSKVYAVYAFDPKTGARQWTAQVSALILDAPVYAEGTLYFGTDGGRVYALDAATGQARPGWAFEASNAVWGSPLVAGGRVYVASLDHFLYCLDADTGEVLWKFEAKGAMAAQPSLDEERGIVYVGDFAARVYAVHADSGQAVEGFNAPQAGNWIWSKVLVTGDRLYVTSLDGKLYGLDPATGAALPGYPFDLRLVLGGTVIRAAPVQAGELILVASQQGSLTAIQGATGQKQWGPWTPANRTGAQILTTPVVADGIVYVAVMPVGQPAEVYALSVETGVQSAGNWPAPPPPSQ